MELAEKVIPGPRLRVTVLVVGAVSVPLRKAFAVGDALICSTRALTSNRSARSHGTNLP